MSIWCSVKLAQNARATDLLLACGNVDVFGTIRTGERGFLNSEWIVGDSETGPIRRSGTSATAVGWWSRHVALRNLLGACGRVDCFRMRRHPGEQGMFIEQERNLLHVAKTRAREQLFVSHAGRRSDLLVRLVH